MDASILIPIAVLGLGALLALAVAGRRERLAFDRVLVSLAWGPGLAAGILSLVGFFGLVLGCGEPGRGALLAALLVPVAVAWWVGRGPRSELPAVDRRDVTGDLARRTAWGVLAALSIGYAWTFARWLSDRPLGSFDGMAIWTYRALQWYRSGDGFPETIAMLVESKPGYPLLLPGLLTSQFTLWGGESTVIPVATGWLFVVGVAAATTLAVARCAPRAVALAAAALLLSTPLVWRWAFAQSADLALAYLTAAAALGLVDLTVRGRRSSAPAWLVGFFLGLMVWTKNEGSILAVILLFVAASSAVIVGRRLAPAVWVAVALGSLPAVVATTIFKTGWVAAGETGRYLGPGIWSRLLDPTRWSEVSAAFAERLMPLSGDALWGGTVAVLMVMLVATVMRLDRAGGVGSVTLVYGLPVVCAVGIDAVIYLATPEPLQWHLRTSLDRLLLQVLPLAVIAVFVGVGGDGGGREVNEHDRSAVLPPEVP